MFLICTFLLQHVWCENAKWISSSENNVNEINTWIAFRKNVQINNIPSIAVTKIAVDSKYWLWINGKLAIFEGGLKRGPSPISSYYDEVDIAPFLKKGENQIAILIWYFGKDGFSHKSSGKAGLLFALNEKNIHINSDSTWYCKIHPAYQSAGDPQPNYRLPESNIRYDANYEMKDWQTCNDMKKFNFKGCVEIGVWNDAPWGKMILRPIPFWKDFGVKNANFEIIKGDVTDSIIVPLPYNMQMTPIIDVYDHDGCNVIEIYTNHTFHGGEINLRVEYVTKQGQQWYESLGWLNGTKLILVVPKHVKINSVKYRETGYDCLPIGNFICDNDFYMRFWKKALNTLYVNMRDTYFDCPDRERAQWWGDEVILQGECFYSYSTSVHKLMRKGIYELCAWQHDDNTLFSPIPSGNYDSELPGQMLAAIGKYGFWNYYMNTGDKATIEMSYPHVKRYLALWKTDENGLTVLRHCGWLWGDWGDNKDMRLIIAGMHCLALEGAVNMANLLGYTEDAANFQIQMDSVKIGFNKCWNGYDYRDPQYNGATDDRVQAIAVIARIASEDKYACITDVLKNQFYAGPYMEKYIMEALFIMGQGKYALERTEKRFSKMVNDPYETTLFEGWSINDNSFGGGTSNHAWSGGPLTVIAQYQCGIYPLEAGYKSFTIHPQPASLKYTDISVPTVKGMIFSSWKIIDGNMDWQLSVPKGTTAHVSLLTDNDNKVKIDGMPLNKQTFKHIDGHIEVLLSEGSHIINTLK